MIYPLIGLYEKYTIRIESKKLLVLFLFIAQVRELREVDITNVDCQLTVSDGVVEKFCSQTGMKKQCMTSKVSFSKFSHRKFQTVFLRKV